MNRPSEDPTRLSRPGRMADSASASSLNFQDTPFEEPCLLSAVERLIGAGGLALLPVQGDREGISPLLFKQVVLALVRDMPPNPFVCLGDSPMNSVEAAVDASENPPAAASVLLGGFGECSDLSRRLRVLFGEPSLAVGDESGGSDF